MTSTALDPQESSPPIVAEAVRVPLVSFLTLESVLWLLVGIVAFGLRILDLARWPLSENEAVLALQAWRLTSGSPVADLLGTVATASPDPLSWNLGALVFLLFGAGDAAARFPQVLGGTLLVLSPWLLRPLLGRGHALAASGLLLLSPTVLFWSRQASGEVWAALAALVLVAGVARWMVWRATRDALLAAVALGLGLASGPGFWTVLAAGALWGAWDRWRNRRAGDAAEPIAFPDASVLTRYGAVALLVFLLAATGFFLNLEGLGAALGLPVRWLGLLFTSPSLVFPFALVFLLYEALALVAGLVGAGQLAPRRPRWTAFGLLWAGVTIVPATVFNSGWAGGFLFVVVPLVLLGGALVVRVVESLAVEGRWAVEGLFLGFSAALFLYVWINLNAYLANSSQFVGIVSVVVALVMFLAAVVLVWQSYGGGAAQRALGITLLILFGLVSLSSAWGLSLTRGADPREPMVTQPSSADLRTGAAELAQLSIERYRNVATIALAMQETLGYAPRWYFRDFTDVTFVQGSNSNLPEAALLAFEAPAPPERIGQRIWLGPQWPGFPADSLGQLRWLVSRNEPVTLTDRAAILYVTIPQPE